MTRIAFVYNRRHRLVDDPQVRFTRDRNIIITGTDADHGKVRTFRVDRITGEIRHIPVQRQAGTPAPR